MNESRPLRPPPAREGGPIPTVPDGRRVRRFQPRLQPVPVERPGREALDGLREAPPGELVRTREHAHRWRLALADVVAAGASIGAVLALDPGAGSALLVLLAPVLVIVCQLGGLYERDALVLNKTTLDEAPALVQLTGVFTLVVWLCHDGLSDWNLRPTDGLEIWAGSTALALALRALARGWVRRRSAAERCLIVGAPESIRAVEAKLGAVAATVVSRIPLDAGGGLGFLVARPDHFHELVRRHGVQRVIIAPLESDAGDTLDLIRIAKSGGLRVSVVPRLLEVVGSSVEFDHIEGLTMLGVRSFGLPRSARAIKRSFDVLASSALLVLASPVMAAIALAVRLDSPGRILFHQTRIGRDGRPFEMLKFRSMVADAEDRKRQLMHLNETDGLFKITEDPRVTRTGRFLRASSLDELPQLFNVLLGEMSIVGPRPLVVDEDAKVGGLDRARLHLTPGMTGHWQILGSARVPLEEMVGIDYLYVANWSLWTDLKILLRTAVYVLSRRGV